MKIVKNNNIYVIRLEKGEELMENLWNFCEKQGIKGGYFSGLGASDDIDIAYFDTEKNEYCNKNFSGKEFEVTCLMGNVTSSKLHIHVTIADGNQNAFGGHLFRLVVNPTIEIFLTPMGELKRFKDEVTGLEFMDI